MSDTVAPSVPTNASPDTGLGDSSVPTSNPESVPTPAPKKRFIDFDGEQVDYDELKRERQKYRGADGRFREAAAAKKEVEDFIKKLQEDPETILSDKRLPIDKKRLAEKWLMEAIEAEMKDPRELALEQKDAELQKYKSQEEKAKAEAEKSRQEAFRSERRESIAKTFGEALANSPLSKDPETAQAALREMAMYMRVCKSQGHTPDAKELAQHVEGRSLKSMRGAASALEGEDLLSFFGDAVVAKMRKADLAKLRAQREKPETVQAEDWQQSKSDAPRKFMDPRDALIKK